MPTFAYELQRPSTAIRIMAFVAVVPITLGLAVILYVLAWTVPRFAEIFAKFKVEPPVATQILCNISLVVRHFWYLFGLTWVAATAGLISWIVRASHHRWLVLTAVIGFGSWILVGLLIGVVVILLFQPLVELIQQVSHK